MCRGPTDRPGADMTAWWIAPVVLVVIGIGAVLRYRRLRSLNAPLTDHWIASHGYGKGGDDRQWK